MAWVIQQDEKSFCPSCGTAVDLLCNDGLGRKVFSWFYICWICKKVFQVGVGEVRREVVR